MALGKVMPLELKLELESDRVPKGGRLHFRLTIRNLGNRPAYVFDNIFKDPMWLGKNKDVKSGAYLVIENISGRPAFELNDWGPGMFCHPEVTTVAIPSGQLPDAADDPAEGLFKPDPSYSRLALKPREAISTPAWSAPKWVECKEVRRPTVGSYSELWTVFLDAPGEFRVKAVYDHPMDAETRRLLGKEAYGAVHVETPWIRVLVR